RTVWLVNTSGVPKGSGSSSNQRGASVVAQVVIQALVGDPSAARACKAQPETPAAIDSATAKREQSCLFIVIEPSLHCNCGPWQTSPGAARMTACKHVEKAFF